MANCKQCNNVFEAKRSTALYCSDNCRAIASKVAHRPVALIKVALTGDEKVALSTEGETAEWPPLKATPVEWKAWMDEHRPNYLRVLRSQAVGGEAGYKDYTQLREGEYNRVAKPGDEDYEGPKGPGVCRKCGAETQSPLVTCCYSCAMSKNSQPVALANQVQA